MASREAMASHDLIVDEPIDEAIEGVEDVPAIGVLFPFRADPLVAPPGERSDCAVEEFRCLFGREMVDIFDSVQIAPDALVLFAEAGWLAHFISLYTEDSLRRIEPQQGRLRKCGPDIGWHLKRKLRTVTSSLTWSSPVPRAASVFPC
jgi:hypothetical protein